MRKTYLRYPGGKSKAIKHMEKFVPDFDEYRETMVGGGSMFLAMKKAQPEKTFWINDIYSNLYLFWKNCRDNNAALVDMLLKIKSDTSEKTCADRFKELKTTISIQDELTRSAYFYYMNKCSFSGLTESGTCSVQAWTQNFSVASIKSLSELEGILQGVKITNLDYTEVVKADGENVFIYLDPPYDIGKANMLYGRNGETHRSFDHVRFYEEIKDCKHKAMISYNDSTLLRDRFSGMNVHTLDFRYTMRLMKKDAPKKTELVVCNYE